MTVGQGDLQETNPRRGRGRIQDVKSGTVDCQSARSDKSTEEPHPRVLLDFTNETSQKVEHVLLVVEVIGVTAGAS